MADFKGKIDGLTGAQVGIDYSHHETHDGCNFYYIDVQTLSNGNTLEYLITTPNTTKWAHFGYELTSTGVTEIGIYEGSDKNGTTLQNVLNRNRNSLIANTTTLHK